MSWTDFPHSFIEKNWTFFENVLTSSAHGECKAVELFGKFACQVLIEPQDMLVINGELLTPNLSQAPRRIRLWSLEKRMDKIHAITLSEPDLFFTCRFSPNFEGWHTTGSVKNRFMNSKPAVLLKKQFLVAKLSEA